MAWLEQFLKAYRGTVLAITHDRCARAAVPTGRKWAGGLRRTLMRVELTRAGTVRAPPPHHHMPKQLSTTLPSPPSLAAVTSSTMWRAGS